MKISDLSSRDGTWHAVVTLPIPPDGKTYHVDRRFGSWRITPEVEGGGYTVVRPEVAAALQRTVRREERRRKAATCRP